MSDLATLQAEMAEVLLTGRYGAVADQVLAGPIDAEEALGLHRSTVVHGLINALRISHPTVDALVGEAFFDQAALAFVEEHPPSGAWLADYGSGFADFLAAYELARGLPYLPDVARLDFAIETAAAAAVGRDGVALDLDKVVLTLDASLRLVELDYPAAGIRDALEHDEEALGQIDMRPCRHALALWRLPEGAGLRPLSRLSAAFLDAAMAGGDLERALASGGDPGVLQAEVFTAPFARLSLRQA